MRNQAVALGWGSVLAGAAILAAGAWWWYVSREEMAKPPPGPTPITTEQLLAMGEGKEPPSRHVTYTAPGDPIPANVRSVRGGMTVSGFVLVPVGRRYLIAEVESGYSGRTFTGFLGVWKEGVQADAVPAIQRAVGNQAGRILQFQLDTRREPGPRLASYSFLFFVGLGGGLFVLCGLACVVRGHFERDRPAFEASGVPDRDAWLRR